MSSYKKSKAGPQGWGGALAAIMLVLLALVAYQGISSMSANMEARQRAISAELERRHCVVADMAGHAVKSYRCDSPTPGQYVPATVIYQDALRVAS